MPQSPTRSIEYFSAPQRMVYCLRRDALTKMTKPPKNRPIQAVQPKWQNVPESRRRIMRAIRSRDTGPERMYGVWHTGLATVSGSAARTCPAVQILCFHAYERLFLCMDAFGTAMIVAGGPDPC